MFRRIFSFRVRGVVRAVAGIPDRARRPRAAGPPDLAHLPDAPENDSRAPAVHGGRHPLQLAPGRGGRRPGAAGAARARQHAHGDLEHAEAGVCRSGARSRRRGGRGRHHRRRRADRRRAGGSLSLIARWPWRAPTGTRSRGAAHRRAHQGLRRLSARGDAHPEPDAERARDAAAGGGRLQAGASRMVSQASGRDARRQRAGRRAGRAGRRTADADRRRPHHPRRQLWRAPDSRRADRLRDLGDGRPVRAAVGGD